MAQALGTTEEEERVSVLHSHVKQTLEIGGGQRDAAQAGGSTNLLAPQAGHDRELVTCQLSPGKAESLHTHPLLPRAGRAPSADRRGEESALSDTASTNARGTGPRSGRGSGGDDTRWLRPPPDAGKGRREKGHTHGRTAAALPGPPRAGAAHSPTRDVRGQSPPPEARRGPVSSPVVAPPPPQPCGPGTGRARPPARDTLGDS